MKCAAGLVLALCWAVNGGAQTAGSSGSGTTTGGATGGATGGISSPRTTLPPSPSTPNTNPNPPSSTPRPIFISGTVITDDGLPVPANMTIQRVCGGNPRSVAYTDSKGRFGFQWNQQNGMMEDASEAAGGRRLSSLGGFGGSGQSSQGLGGASGPADNFGMTMANCELRASAPGYRSDSVNLGSRGAMDNPDVGSIVIHRMGAVEGLAVSATSLLAPKDARKAFDQGLQALQKNKNADAEKSFEKAVDVYPKYAEAWMNLGRIRLREGANEPAREALLKAVEADAKLVGPYVELGMLAAQEKRWEDSSRYLDRAVRLDPIDFPEAWFADAVANYNLKRYDLAEKSAREAVRLDPKHVNPRAEYLLGLALIAKRDYPAAAGQLKSYLRLYPEGSDAAMAKTQVAELERAILAAGGAGDAQK